MARALERDNFAAFLTVAEAARLLGVSVSTLRNWDRQGRLVARRHPLNGYRLYDRGSLDRILTDLNEEPKEGSQ